MSRFKNICNFLNITLSVKVMRQWGLTPSVETYLTLACACARHGDIPAMEKVISEASSQGLPFRYQYVHILLKNTVMTY